jgi:hypothetical protein
LPAWGHGRFAFPNRGVVVRVTLKYTIGTRIASPRIVGLATSALPYENAKPPSTCARRLKKGEILIEQFRMLEK